MNTEENPVARSSKLQRELNTAGRNFIQVELDTSLTFAQQALDAGDDLQKRSQDQANARKGYDTLKHLSERFSPPLSEADQQEFELKFRHLKAALRQLGETV